MNPLYSPPNAQCLVVTVATQYIFVKSPSASLRVPPVRGDAAGKGWLVLSPRAAVTARIREDSQAKETMNEWGTDALGAK